MKPLLATLLVTFCAALANAQRVEFFVDGEGVRRSGVTSDFASGATRFEPQFRTGGGAGGGVNFFLSDRVSIEAKLAALATKTRVRIVGSDFIGTADLGWTQLYPISAVLQWHLAERGAVRPYIGAGVVHTVLRNINKQVGAGATGIRFKDPTGLVLDGGLEIAVARKWSLLGDARYVPIETRSRATFPGTTSALDMRVRPLIVSFGLGYRF
ncbi:MAG TPA: OmpW family outer membrane protein [Candidatus Tumulicola sp.]|nr:OmpW family outer membrane protein [Candidatus Tumulicola sp.]